MSRPPLDGSSMRADIVAKYLAEEDHGPGIWRYQGTDEKYHYLIEEKLGYAKWMKVPRAGLELPKVFPHREEWGGSSFYYSIDILNGFARLPHEQESHRKLPRPPAPVVIPAPGRPKDFGLSAAAIAAAPAADLKVDIDTSAVVAQSPEIQLWATHAAEVCRTWYPVIAQVLGRGSRLPKQITLVFVPHALSPAYCDGAARIYFDTTHVLEEPTNYGMAVHELCHVVQQSKARLSWVTEGIADYVRYYLYEFDPTRGSIRAGQSHYTDSYWTTARFLDFVVRTYDPQIILRLSTAMRDPATDEATIRRIFLESSSIVPPNRKTIDALWADFIAAAEE
ncbi:MAG: basic secretory protein-like protein [Opitutaceae bacterium]